MEIQLPDFIKELINTFHENNYEAFVVGGAVRDLLVGRHVEDWDLTTNATPEEMLEILPEESFYDNAFGTVMVPNSFTSTPFDITTYRSEEGYSNSRKPDVVKWGKTLEDDLKRRDFTINAMAIKIKSEKLKVKNHERIELIDYFSGKKDLDNRIIRAVGDPNERFEEDALRMMRAVRIASELNFKIEEKTKNAIYMNRERLHKISAERIKTEFFKLLASPHVYNGLIQMREVGLIETILPELEKAFGVEQKSPGRHHVFDVGTHLMMSLKYCKSTDPLVRFATLIHDIGKPQTYHKLATGTITFYNHEVVGAKIAKNIADRLKFSNVEKDRLWKLVRFHQFTVDENQSDKALRRFIRNVGIDNLYDMLELRTADRLGSGSNETSWRTEEFKARLLEVQKQPFSVQDLKISGTDVMEILNIKPGKKVGEILSKLFEEVDDGKIKNDRELLIERIKELK